MAGSDLFEGNGNGGFRRIHGQPAFTFHAQDDGLAAELRTTRIQQLFGDPRHPETKKFLSSTRQ